MYSGIKNLQILKAFKAGEFKKSGGYRNDGFYKVDK